MTVVPACRLSRADLRRLGPNLAETVRRDRCAAVLDDVDAIFAPDLAGLVPQEPQNVAPQPNA